MGVYGGEPYHQTVHQKENVPIADGADDAHGGQLQGDGQSCAGSAPPTEVHRRLVAVVEADVGG